VRKVKVEGLSSKMAFAAELTIEINPQSKPWGDWVLVVGGGTLTPAAADGVWTYVGSEIVFGTSPSAQHIMDFQGVPADFHKRFCERFTGEGVLYMKGSRTVKEKIRWEMEPMCENQSILNRPQSGRRGAGLWA
jgi:hypothetical protein